MNCGCWTFTRKNPRAHRGHPPHDQESSSQAASAKQVPKVRDAKNIGMAVVLVRVKRNENDLRQKTTRIPARGVHPSRHEKEWKQTNKQTNKQTETITEPLSLG